MTDLLKPGDRLSPVFDMTITEKIAEGGMGEVYEAILHGASGFEKRIALKVVRSEFLHGPGLEEPSLTAAREMDFLTRLVNEAKLVSNLIHTHIVQIYLLGTAGGGQAGLSGFIAMEYVRGVSLRSFIDRHLFESQEMPVEIAVYIASRLARALEYAHMLKDRDGTPLDIVHRDVSPTNVLLSVEGVVKLSDFGIAKALHHDPHTRDYVVGKKRYMAPEQFETGDVDFRADLFSLGILLFEMLTSRLPDRASLPARPSSLRDGVPPEVDEIVARCLQPEAGRRYGQTTELAVDLERAIYGKGYGPTFVTLAQYLKTIFPALGIETPKAGVEERTMIHR